MYIVIKFYSQIIWSLNFIQKWFNYWISLQIEFIQEWTNSIRNRFAHWILFKIDLIFEFMELHSKKISSLSLTLNDLIIEVHSKLIWPLHFTQKWFDHWIYLLRMFRSKNELINSDEWKSNFIQKWFIELHSKSIWSSNFNQNRFDHWISLKN